MRSVSDSRHPDDYMSVEVAYPQGRDEIIFYCAVPTDKTQLFRAQLVAVFPNIKIVVASNDYNIFNKREHIALSVAELKKSDLLPIKVYEDFNYDPLNIILESFSNLIIKRRFFFAGSGKIVGLSVSSFPRSFLILSRLFHSATLAFVFPEFSARKVFNFTRSERVLRYLFVSALLR